MALCVRNLFLCLFLLLNSGAAAGDSQASRVTNQKILPLAMQYRQKLLRIVEAPPASTENPLAASAPTAGECAFLARHDAPALSTVSVSIGAAMSLQL
jgi:hypothetical protein